jgi:hypothetical protein
MNPIIIAEFIRTLGLAAGMFADKRDVERIANLGADLITAGAAGAEKFAALTEEMKARKEAGVHATTAEIDDVLARIQARSERIQGTPTD